MSIESGDATISAIVTPAARKSKRGGVVLVHGFAAEKTENGLFLPLHNILAANGWWVLSYDWRGLGDSTGEFANTDLDVHVKDFQRVTSWFSEEAGLAKRLCSVGFSLGATIVALAVKHGMSLRSAVFLSPALRPSQDMWPRYNTPEIRRALETDGFILKNNIRVGCRFLESLRTTDLAPSEEFSMGIPLLVCHGTADERIPFTTSQKVFSKRSDAEFHAFPGASHSFRPENTHREELTNVLLQWLPHTVMSAKATGRRAHSP